jgi:uncharacterized membrane protein
MTSSVVAGIVVGSAFGIGVAGLLGGVVGALIGGLLGKLAEERLPAHDLVDHQELLCLLARPREL